MSVFDPDQDQMITLEQDPAAWARNLHTTLRASNLVPVMVEDTNPD